jgi:hypothetical protein
VRTDYVLLLRDAAGDLEVIHDRHTTGLFTTETWLRLLADVGFEPNAVEEVTVTGATHLLRGEKTAVARRTRAPPYGR